MNIDLDIPSLAAGLRAVVGILRRRLREQGSLGDFTPSQTDVLRHLEREGATTTSKLAREAGMRSQSMGPIVSSLEADGMVRCSQDPDDGRQTLISLTPLCRDKIAKGRAAREDWLADQIAKLSAEDQAHLVAATAILHRISDQ